MFVCFNALHLYLKSVFSLYRWKWKVGSKNSLWYCEHGQWNLLITMKIIAMRSQSSYVMGQLTLRWNLMKSVKLKGGNLILCCVRYQYLFAGFRYCRIPVSMCRGASHVPLCKEYFFHPKRALSVSSMSCLPYKVLF